MKQIGEELGIAYLVQGSVRKSGDRVRITAQLSDVATGSQLLGGPLRPQARRCLRGTG